MKDSGKDGLAEVSCMQSIVDNMKSKTRILVASVRSANEVADLAGMRRGQEELAQQSCSRIVVSVRRELQCRMGGAN